MKQLKQIITQRIKSLTELQQLLHPHPSTTNNKTIPQSQPQSQSQPPHHQPPHNPEPPQQPHPKKYQLILQHKKAEKQRSSRQSELLTEISLYGEGRSGGTCRCERDLAREYFQFCRYSVEVFGMYDLGYQRVNIQVDDNTAIPILQQYITKIYSEFFARNGFKQKSEHINNTWRNSTSIHSHSQKQQERISLTLLLAWLSQWSKKVYCDLLREQIQRTYKQPDRSFRPNPIPLQCTAPVTVTLDTKKRLQQSQQQNLAMTANLGSIHQLSSTTNISDLNNTTTNTNINEPTYQLSFFNKSSVHCFFLDDLVSYYKLCGFQGIDAGYLKGLRKRNRKEEFLKASNIAKAADTLIQTTVNRDIHNIRKLYYIQYLTKYPKKLKIPKKTSKTCNIKRLAVLQSIKRARNITETDESHPQHPQSPKKSPHSPNTKSKILSAKFSEFQFIKPEPEEIEAKIKRLKIINQRSVRNNIQFPGISRREISRNQLKQLICNKGYIHPATSFGRKLQSPTSVQTKMKKQDFLKCQSIQVKYKNQQNPQFLKQYFFQPSFHRSNNNSTNELKNSNSYQFSSEYDDNKMKIAKKFEVYDLRKNFKLAITKRAEFQEICL